jgi:hypothetical protein
MPAGSKCLLISLPGYSQAAKEFLSGKPGANLIAADLRDLFL